MPTWLAPPPANLKKERRELIELTFNTVFDTVLDQLSSGKSLAEIIAADHRDIDYARFLNWICRDPERKMAYYNAQEIGTEAISDELLSIVDGTSNPMEDTQRSKLRAEYRWKLISARNARRFGEKQSNVGPAVQVIVCRDGTYQGNVIDSSS